MATDTVTNSDYLKNSVSIGSIRGAKIRIHWTFFFLFLFNCLVSFLSPAPVLRVLLHSGLLYGPCMLFSILFHEMGHVAATWKLGGQVDQIILWPLGGLTFYGPSTTGHIGDLKVALAGPIMQIPLIITLAIIYVVCQSDDMRPLSARYAYNDEASSTIGVLLLSVVRLTFWYNIFVSVINTIVPIYPLDSVRIWASVLKIFGASLIKSAKTVSISGMVAGASLGVFGLVKMFHHHYVGGIAEFVLGAFGFAGSKALFDTIKAGRLKDDPIFGRACYDQGDDQDVEMRSDSGNNPNSAAVVEQPVPIQTFDTEML